ncbi:zinc finger HIT domain-containing protein 2-like [Lytechinus pictus]|uniref:zinc finger HIT domain-containing protein 2-like n=1 Tax=Lytechinus pictus TaxID=7653 RepID=UPI0030BA131D
MAAPMNKDESGDLRLRDDIQENETTLAQTRVCNLCVKVQASYTCPRCNISYCSLACYKSEKHSDCSESFYKNNFIQALKETKGSSDDKKAVLEMLSRLDAEEIGNDSDDDDDVDESEGTESLEKRLAGLDLDNEPDKVWEKLTKQERQEFEEVVRAGALGSMLEQWTPWWTKHDRELISEVEEETHKKKGSKVTTSDPPMLLDSVPRLSELLKTPPSPLMVFNMINVLYCYAFVVRFYNGSHMDIPLHACQCFLEVCPGMSANVSFSSTEDAIESAIQTITQLKSVSSERKHLVSLIQDVIHIMLGRSKSSPSFYVESALSDLHQLLKQAKLIYKVPETSRSDIKKSKSAMFLAKKKVTFYLAWVRENRGVMKLKAAEVKVLHKTMERDVQKHELVKAGVEKNIAAVQPRKTSKLIEEIS